MLSSQHDWLLSSIHQIIVTDSDRGGQVFINGLPAFNYPAESVTAVDNTGAGDAFVVGYVSATLAGRDPQVAVRWGAQNAASVVQQIGAKDGLLHLQEFNSD